MLVSLLFVFFWVWQGVFGASLGDIIRDFSQRNVHFSWLEDSQKKRYAGAIRHVLSLNRELVTAGELVLMDARTWFIHQAVMPNAPLEALFFMRAFEEAGEEERLEESEESSDSDTEIEWIRLGRPAVEVETDSSAEE